MSMRLAIALVFLSLATAAFGQRGQYDKVPTNPVDEAYIFTPSGFDRAGQPAVAKGEQTARLRVKIVDTATGKPTFCRVNVVGPDGNYYQPADLPLADYSLIGRWPDRQSGNRESKAPIRYFGHFFYTGGEFEVTVPAGKSRLEVWKGFEYRPEFHTVEAAAGSQQEVTIGLTRSAAMAPRGYYSGDPHLHFARTNDRDDNTIFDLMEAEDMRFGMILAYNETDAYPGVMPELITPQLRGLGKRSIRRRGDYQIISGQEYRNVVFGHILLLLRDSLALDGQRLDPNRGPVFGKIGVETREQGGQAFHAHGGYAQEIWADLVQGATSGVELLQFGIYRGIGLDGWYHVLNSGFRFPGVGACDYPACRKLGDCRTYAYVDGEPDFEKWLASAAAGRSFMTTGPLLLLDVDGNRPGAIISTKEPGPYDVKARLEVLSETCPVTDVHLIVNGRVVKEVRAKPAAGESQRIVVEEKLRLTGPSWIAARAFSKSPTGTPDAESHTNPVYFDLGGKRAYSAADVDWLMARLDEQVADHKARDVQEKGEAIDYFQHSRQILLDIKQQGGMNGSEPLKSSSPSDDATSAAPARDAASPENLADFLKPVPAKSPAEALKSFEVQDGFEMQLVACEPDVTDPVAACFDENGGMYVAEMIDYPYRPKEGQPLGRVRYLEDTDGDGRFDKSVKFAEGLAWPTGVVCWKGGVFVAAAPDIWYCRDTDGDRVADIRERAFSGFGDRNQQGGVNNLAWHIDHHIYGSGSTNGGEITAAGNSTGQPIQLSGHDFRFDPVARTFETVTGSRQFGNAFDDWFNRFICSESKPLYHVVLPEHYLARNPLLAVPRSLEDLAPGVTPIFRISPIERWRQIRSSRRLAAGERGENSAGLSHNVIDAAAGLTIYRGHAYGEAYLGQMFVGCSQNNLIHRRRLIPDGVTFRSERIDEATEFVRSTDTWFRPVNCLHAPDGTLYVLDMSREVIEAIHIPQDVVKHLDLTSGRDKGRIYRLAPPGFKPAPQPKLGSATNAELVGYLEHPGGWWRDTAARLLFERQDRGVVELLRQRLHGSESAVGRMHMLWALEGLGALAENDLLAGLADGSPRVREHAVRLAVMHANPSPQVVERLLALAGDEDARVRFQVAFALGETGDPRRAGALAGIAARDFDDAWLRAAVLSSSLTIAGQLAAELAGSDALAGNAAKSGLLEELAAMVGARNESREVRAVLDAAAGCRLDSPPQRALLVGLGTGLRRAGQSLASVQVGASSAAADMLGERLVFARNTLHDPEASPARQVAEVKLLSLFGDSVTAADFLRLVDPARPEAVQRAALDALSAESDPTVAEHLIGVWQRSTPVMQEALLRTLASRAARARSLLEACQAGQVNASLVTASTRTALANHSDEQVRELARAVFAADASPRNEIVAAYQTSLSLAGDAVRGLTVYERECAACHQLGQRGFAVGPNLALVRNRTAAALLEAILDPNREVPPNYVNYVVLDTSGRTFTGLIAAETAASVTVARDKGASDTVLKQDIDQIKSTGKSLMPEGLEKTVDPQAMADLLAFLGSVRYDIGTLPDFAETEN